MSESSKLSDRKEVITKKVEGKCEGGGGDDRVKTAGRRTGKKGNNKLKGRGLR